MPPSAEPPGAAIPHFLTIFIYLRYYFSPAYPCTMDLNHEVAFLVRIPVAQPKEALRDMG